MDATSHHISMGFQSVPRFPQAGVLKVNGFLFQGTLTGFLKVHVLAFCSGPFRRFLEYAWASKATSPKSWQFAGLSCFVNGRCSFFFYRIQKGPYRAYRGPPPSSQNFMAFLRGLPHRNIECVRTSLTGCHRQTLECTWGVPPELLEVRRVPLEDKTPAFAFCSFFG